MKNRKIRVVVFKDKSWWREIIEIFISVFLHLNQETYFVVNPIPGNRFLPDDTLYDVKYVGWK